ncbi:hypothetical protein L9F63_000194, partial [Diploptera punctata]
ISLHDNFVTLDKKKKKERKKVQTCVCVCVCVLMAFIALYVLRVWCLSEECHVACTVNLAKMVLIFPPMFWSSLVPMSSWANYIVSSDITKS